MPRATRQEGLSGWQTTRLNSDSFGAFAFGCTWDTRQFGAQTHRLLVSISPDTTYFLLILVFHRGVFRRAAFRSIHLGIPDP